MADPRLNWWKTRAGHARHATFQERQTTLCGIDWDRIETAAPDPVYDGRLYAACERCGGKVFKLIELEARRVPDDLIQRHHNQRELLAELLARFKKER